MSPIWRDPPTDPTPYGGEGSSHSKMYGARKKVVAARSRLAVGGLFFFGYASFAVLHACPWRAEKGQARPGKACYVFPPSCTKYVCTYSCTGRYPGINSPVVP